MLTVKDLHKYQRYCANQVLKKTSLFLFLDMGLGKTVSVLSAVEYLQRVKEFKSALIIAPLRVCYSVYPDEISKWQQLQNLSYHIIHGKGKIKQLPQRNLYISNYETLKFLFDISIWQKCDILIIDESTAIKNSKTARFKTIKKFAGKFRKRICMTSTPSPSGELQELWSQTFVLDGGKRFGTSFWQFKNKYYDKDFMGYNWDLKPGARKIIQDKIKDISVTMSAADYIQMPDKINTVIPFDLPAPAMGKYREMEREFIIQLRGDVITAANAAVMSGKLRQITAGGLYDENKKYNPLHTGKIDALKEIIDGVSGNILVGFQFKFEKNLIQRVFPDAQFIDGACSPEKSRQIIWNWNKGNVKMLCCHPASAGHGLNLQAAGHILVWLSLDWSLERQQQFEARLYRQGQQNTVFIYTIAAKNTIDYAVAESLKQKHRGQESLIAALKQYVKEV